MSGRFEGNFDRIERAIESALNPTSIAFAKAANQYVKKDTGATEASVWIDSDFPKGKLVWGTEYAGYAYYTILKHLDGGLRLRKLKIWMKYWMWQKKQLRRLCDGFICTNC